MAVLSGSMIHRHTGGLEMTDLIICLCACIHRHTGGLEKVHRHTGHDIYIHRHTGGLEITALVYF